MLTIINTFVVTHLNILLAGGAGVFLREVHMLLAKDAGLIKAAWLKIKTLFSKDVSALEKRIAELEAKLK